MTEPQTAQHWTSLPCEHCNAPGRECRIIGPDGEDLTSEQYIALAHLAGRVILCDSCGEAAGLTPAAD